MVQLSHPYMTTGKTTALTRWTFVGKVMSLLFNILSQWIWVTLGLTFVMRPHFPMNHFVTSSRSSYWLHCIAQDLVYVWFALWHLLLWDWECDLALISAFAFPSILSFFLHWFSIYQNYPETRYWPNTLPEWMQCTSFKFSKLSFASCGSLFSSEVTEGQCFII